MEKTVSQLADESCFASQENDKQAVMPQIYFNYLLSLSLHF